MSSQQERQTLFIPVDLGSPARYDRSIFQLMKIKGESTSLREVDFVLEATLDEIFRMRNMAGNINELQQLILDAKDEYDELNSKKEKLEQTKKSLNPIKLFSTYRSIRLLAEAGRALWLQTRSASERMRRQLLSVHAQDMQPVDHDDLPSDARITGVALSTEANTQLDDTTASFFTEAASFIASQLDLLPDGNPFADDYEAEDLRSSAPPEHSSTSNSSTDDGAVPSTSSSSPLSDASSLGSPSSRQGSGNNYFIFQNSYVASRSVIQTPTLNSGGSRNQGSSVRR
ncbi:hypothetical protein BDR05DRAFT_968718 [Suillus weaverae]|nr:hypothetical protein BDR05DRAFT_968718 [Suillus weaverae]